MKPTSWRRTTIFTGGAWVVREIRPSRLKRNHAETLKLKLKKLALKRSVRSKLWRKLHLLPRRKHQLTNLPLRILKRRDNLFPFHEMPMPASVGIFYF